MPGDRMVQPNLDDVIFWADTLVVDFPTDDIPTLIDANEWKGWGNDLIACTSFTLNDAPATYNYDNWQAWAWDVFFVMTNFA